MTNNTPPPRRLRSQALEFYRLTLEHREKVISIIVASGIAVAIPASVDVYKARLQQQLNSQEQKLKELEFRQRSIQSFSSTGLQQDIELRLRLAEYFSNLSDDEY